MAVYFIYMLFAGVQSWYASKKGLLQTTKGKVWYVTTCCVELIILAALRGHTVGADTIRYVEALEYYSRVPKTQVVLADLVWPFDFEKGYLLFTQLCALINMPAPIFLLIVAVVIYVPVFYAIYRYSKVPYISILAFIALGFFSYTLGIFRQMMAMSMILCGLKYIEEKQLSRYLALVVLASTIHTTALIMIPLYILAQIPVKKYWKWVIPAELGCLFFGRTIIELAAKAFPQYAHYFGGKYDIQGGTYLMLILLNALLVAMLYLYYKGFTKNSLAISGLALAVVAQALGYSMAILGRVVVYLSVFSIFAFSEIADVMLNEPRLYGKRIGEALVQRNWCILQIGKLKINLKVILWAIFVAGLFAVAYKDLAGNQYVTPYTFFFMK